MIKKFIDKFVDKKLLEDQLIYGYSFYRKRKWLWKKRINPKKVWIKPDEQI